MAIKIIIENVLLVILMAGLSRLIYENSKLRKKNDNLEQDLDYSRRQVEAHKDYLKFLSGKGERK